MTITLTFEDAVKYLNEVADENPDYFDPWHDSVNGCQYVRHDLPSCIVGRVLAKAAGIEALRDLAGTTYSLGVSCNRVSFGELVLGGYVVADENTKLLLNTAQYVQDIGGTWDAARHAALEIVERAAA
jgi:hypothetical protein